MKKTLFFLIFFCFFFIIIGLSTYLIIFSFKNIKSDYIDILTSNLESVGHSLLLTVNPLIREKNQSDLIKLVEDVGMKTNRRITVIGTDGTVLAESEIDPFSMDNHSNRPEIVQALNGEVGKSIRYSNSLHGDMLYVALPIMVQDKVAGVLRLSIFINKINILTHSLKLKILLFTIFIIIISLISALLFIKRLLNPLSQLREASSRGAQGDFNTKVYLKKNDLVKEIADNYNIMTEKVDTYVKELSFQKEEFRCIIASMQPGLIVLNKENKIVLYNNSLENIIDQHNIQGQKYWKFFKEPVLFRLIETVQREHKTLRDEMKINNHYYQVSAAYISSLNETVLVFHDVTEIRNLERIKKDFVLNVSHELRTPLTAIKGYAETIEEVGNKNEEFINIIKRHTDRLIHIVEDLLVLSELEEKGISSEPENVRLEIVTDQVIKMFEGRFNKKEIALVVDIEKNLPPVQGDFMRLEQVLINLIDNALKYTDKGEIRISLKNIDNTIEIVIQDTGIGIEQYHIPRIFERFYTVNKSHSRRLGGTGLGLSIVKHIVLLHNGTINVESTPGEGTKFTLLIPIPRSSSY